MYGIEVLNYNHPKILWIEHYCLLASTLQINMIFIGNNFTHFKRKLSIFSEPLPGHALHFSGQLFLYSSCHVDILTVWAGVVTRDCLRARQPCLTTWLVRYTTGYYLKGYRSMASQSLINVILTFDPYSINFYALPTCVTSITLRNQLTFVKWTCPVTYQFTMVTDHGTNTAH